MPYCIDLTSLTRLARFDAEFEALELAICALFLVDVLVTLNTAELHKEKGRYLLTRREVAVYYAKRWLLVDLLSSVPIDILISLTNGAQTKELGLIRLLRFVRVSKVILLYPCSRTRLPVPL